MVRAADIVVVGAGVVGCAIGCELARRGASVEIIDERAAGMGATQASAGILAPYIEAEGRFLDLTVRSLDLFDEFVARLTAESGVAIPYRRTGTLQVAWTPERMSALTSRAVQLEARGVDLRVLDGQGARAEEPCLGVGVVGGLLVPAHGFVAAADLMRALAGAAGRHGAKLTEGGRVHRISSSGSEFTVATDRGAVRANRVVLAAGSWSGCVELAGIDAPLPVRPVRGQLLRLGWNGAPLERVTWSDRCYLVPWDDGTLLVGATVEEAGFDERTTVAGVHDLLDAACEAVPQAWTAAFLGARVGLRPATPDELPIVGASQRLPGLMYATGHFRNGVLLAPLTARLVADAMLNGVVDAALDILRPDRFGDF